MVLARCCMPRSLVEGTKAAVGQRQPPWLESVFLLVFCVLFNMMTLIVVAENRLKSIINNNFL